MKIGKLGLGKLGLPVAEAMAAKGHEVKGYDPRVTPNTIEYATLAEIVGWADIIFASPQTPHAPEYEGSTRLPDTRADFDYKYLKKCIVDVAFEAARQNKVVTLVVISTCLPGTFEREIWPLLNGQINYVYNPFFIAMGTVKEDFYNPEFVLIGTYGDTEKVTEFYKTIHDKPLLETDITTAEGIKVSYNTWITAKTVIANVWGEIATKTGMNFDDLYKAWSLSTERILSPRYMRAGMGDGGGCHPRDNIALSNMARELDLSHDIFSDLMEAREDHEDYHAIQAIDESFKAGLPLILLGKAFKPETDIETGSAAILMANMLTDRRYPFSHYEDLETLPVAVYFISTDHQKYRDYKFPIGSVVINPSNKEVVRHI